LAGDRCLNGDQIALLDFPTARGFRADLIYSTHDPMPEDLWRFAIGPMFSMNVVVVVTAADAAQLDFQYGVRLRSVCYRETTHFNFPHIGDNGG